MGEPRQRPELTDEEEHPDGWLIEALGEVFEGLGDD